MVELVERIDEALATARASEAAVMTVGASALDAAEQAKRAADLAAEANASASKAWERVSRSAPGSAANSSGNGSGNGRHNGGVEDFSARADRLAERLRRLQRVPLGV